MSDKNEDRQLNLGVYENDQRSKITTTEIVAAVLSVLWLAGIALVYSRIGTSTEDSSMLAVMMTLIAAVMPIAMIWVVASVARTTRLLQQETERMQSSITAIRQAYIDQVQAGGLAVKPAMERKLDEIVAATKQTESAIITFASKRHSEGPEVNAPAKAAPPAQTARTEAQPNLAFESFEDTPPPLSMADFISAANFPKTPDDKDGFRAMRKAFNDPRASKLVRSAQDALTLLSEEGVYMDDLQPERARPEIWRRFAKGERGRPISSLGGIHDQSGIALVKARMKSDPIFRDTMHHFLRQFDQTLAAFEPEASDEDLAKLSDTRSARAFMLLGRATGTFD